MPVDINSKELFLDEIMEALINIDFELKKLASNPHDTKQLSQVYQIFHRIKYNCNIVSARKLQEIAEATEFLIDSLRIHLYGIEKFPIGLLQASSEAFISIIRNLLRDGVEGKKDYADLITRLKERTTAINTGGK